MYYKGLFLGSHFCSISLVYQYHSYFHYSSCALRFGGNCGALKLFSFQHCFGSSGSCAFLYELFNFYILYLDVTLFYMHILCHFYLILYF